MRWAVLVLLAVATAPISIVLALYARWWWAGGRGPDSERLPLSWCVAAFGGEVAALTLLAARVLRRGTPRRRAPTAASANIVLLAGGPLGEAALARLIERLDEATWLTTLFHPSSWNIPTAELAAELDTFLRAQEQRAGKVLIGYGNAGLILRHYLRRFPARGLRHVVTIATPHQGTAAPLVGFASPPAPSAETLQQLAAGDRVPHQFDFIAIASDCDEFIAPATSGYYPGAFNIQVRAVGHFALARSRRLFDLLMENLGPPPAQRAAHQASASSMTDSTRAQS